MSKLGRTVIADRFAGTFRQNGTDWPINDQVIRDATIRDVRWVVLTGLCNGTPITCRTFRTRGEALACFRK